MSQPSPESTKWRDFALQRTRPYGFTEVDRWRFVLTAVSDRTTPLQVSDKIESDGLLHVRLVSLSRRPLAPLNVVAQIQKIDAVWANGAGSIEIGLTALPFQRADKYWPEDDAAPEFNVQQSGLATAHALPVLATAPAQSTFFADPQRSKPPSSVPPPGEFAAFISYSHLDRALIRPLLGGLQRRKIPYWLDQEQGSYNDSIISKISGGLLGSKFVVLCMSGNHCQSKWCNEEICNILFRDIKTGDRRILLLLLGDVPEHEIPILLRDRERAVLSNSASLEKLLDFLSAQAPNP